MGEKHDRDEIPEITPVMLEAGANRYLELDEFKGAEPTYLVSEVFRAMWAAGKVTAADKAR